MSDHVNESGRQATARAQAMRVLTEKWGVPWADTSGYLAVWAENHSHSEALAQIEAGVLLPGAAPVPTEKPKVVRVEKPGEAVRNVIRSTPIKKQPAKKAVR